MSVAVMLHIFDLIPHVIYVCNNCSVGTDGPFMFCVGMGVPTCMSNKRVFMMASVPKSFSCCCVSVQEKLSSLKFCYCQYIPSLFH